MVLTPKKPVEEDCFRLTKNFDRISTPQPIGIFPPGYPSKLYNASFTFGLPSLVDLWLFVSGIAATRPQGLIPLASLDRGFFLLVIQDPFGSPWCCEWAFLFVTTCMFEMVWSHVCELCYVYYRLCLVFSFWDVFFLGGDRSEEKFGSAQALTIYLPHCCEDFGAEFCLACMSWTGSVLNSRISSASWMGVLKFFLKKRQFFW